MKQTKKQINTKAKKVRKQKHISLVAEEKRFLRALSSSEFGEYVEFVSNPWKVFLFSMLRGAGIGLGTLFGATVLLTILSLVMRFIYGLPTIGDWIRVGAETIGVKF